jgi:uncharacterized protein
MGYSTFLLDEATERKRHTREELRLHLLEKLDHALYALSGEIPFEDAFLFGSITRPFRFSETSDVDVAFVGLQDADFFRTMSFLSAELGVEVDIVQIESHRLGEKIKREGARWRRRR